MAEPVFSPGFRFSFLDAVVLALGAVLSVIVILSHEWIGIAIAFVVLHFFLFCNILRISRLPELIWAGVFSGLAICATLWGAPTWPIVFTVSLIVTLVIGIVEARRPSYHGICWQLLNPRLPDWWDSQVKAHK